MLSRKVGVKEEQVGGVLLLPRRSRRGSQAMFASNSITFDHFQSVVSQAAGVTNALTGPKDVISDRGSSIERLGMLVLRLRCEFCGCAQKRSYRLVKGPNLTQRSTPKGIRLPVVHEMKAQPSRPD